MINKDNHSLVKLLLQHMNLTFTDCMHRERGTPVVSENWILDSIEKKKAQPLAAYDIASDVVQEGRGLPLGKLDPSEEAIETLAAEVPSVFFICACVFICFSIATVELGLGHRLNLLARDQFTRTLSWIRMVDVSLRRMA